MRLEFGFQATKGLPNNKSKPHQGTQKSVFRSRPGKTPFLCLALVEMSG